MSEQPSQKRHKAEVLRSDRYQTIDNQIRRKGGALIANSLLNKPVYSLKVK